MIRWISVSAWDEGLALDFVPPEERGSVVRRIRSAREGHDKVFVVELDGNVDVIPGRQWDRVYPYVRHIESLEREFDRKPKIKSGPVDTSLRLEALKLSVLTGDTIEQAEKYLSFLEGR